MGSIPTRPTIRNVRPSALRWAEQVPAVAGDVEEDGEAAIRLVAWLGDELHPGGAHPFVRCCERLLDAQEEADPAGVLGADDSGLRRAIGPGEEQSGDGARWPDHDPALRLTVVRGRRRVLDELEAEAADEELDRRVMGMARAISSISALPG